MEKRAIGALSQQHILENIKQCQRRCPTSTLKTMQGRCNPWWRWCCCGLTNRRRWRWVQ